MSREQHNRIVWQNDAWRLRVETAKNNDKKEVGYIEHPGAVVIVPLHIKNGRTELLMLRQYRHAIRQTLLELPAGTRGWDEDWRICAQRELREETGFRAEKLINLGNLWPVPGYSSEHMAVYLASSLEEDPLPQDEDEVIEVVSMPLSELALMAQDGRLRDAKSIVAILRTIFYLETEEGTSLTDDLS